MLAPTSRCEWRRGLGIYGQAAVGGDVGGFFRATAGKHWRARDSKRSRRIGNAGRSAVDRSDQLAGLARDGQIPGDVDREMVSPSLRAAINARLDDVLDQWRNVPQGGDLVLHWPAKLTIRHGQIQARSVTHRS